MNLKEENGSVILSEVECFDPELCLDCGQAFRFRKMQDGSIHGVAGKRILDMRKNGDGYIFYHTTADEFNSFYRDYFDLDRDYGKIVNSFDDMYLSRAVREYYGIRILRQEPWEALCSFIISQNNNIPRIKGIIERLCREFGDRIGGEDYSFPSFELLAEKTPEELAPLRAGFRAGYIIDAAKKVKSGEVPLYDLVNSDPDTARNELMKIKGVGAKVSECTLLYGLNMLDSFPVDVWVKRIVHELYPDGLPECMNGVRGIAQQYLFHWRRNLESDGVTV